MYKTTRPKPKTTATPTTTARLCDPSRPVVAQLKQADSAEPKHRRLHHNVAGVGVRSQQDGLGSRGKSLPAARQQRMETAFDTDAKAF